MSELIFWLSVVFLAAGCLFFAIGILGLFRLPDTLTRIHALTKVDNLGLGLIVVGVLLQTPSLGDSLKTILIWLVALASSATSAHLAARAVRAGGASGHGPTREENTGGFHE